jgi:hypothetical protein
MVEAVVGKALQAAAYRRAENRTGGDAILAVMNQTQQAFEEIRVDPKTAALIEKISMGSQRIPEEARERVKAKTVHLDSPPPTRGAPKGKVQTLGM